jgi:methylisocitrate lyase
MTHPTHPGALFRSLASRGCLALPGAFNALAARAIVRAGFKGCYVSGAAASVCAGVPDVGLLTLDHFAALIRQVADAARDEHGRQLPVIADADTGFGEGEMARRTVIEYHRAGAAGLHLEDQVFPKRCGHLDGKKLLPSEHAAEKVAAAARASLDCSGGDFIVCARTDARGVEGLDAALTRARLYLDAGASMIFPEGLASEDEFARFSRDLRATHPPAMLLANMTEFGKTPMIPLASFAAMGYTCVIYPVTLLRVAMGAVARALDALHREGSAESLLPQMQTRGELYGLIGYEPGVEWSFPAGRAG